MKREDIEELHYIAHIDNLLSILKNGILSHEKAKNIQPKSVANTEVQERRAKVVIPGGKKLHCYANLYFNARNPMMFKRKDIHKELVVIRIDTFILEESGVVIADHNASSNYARFLPPTQDGLNILNSERIFAKYWNDPNPILKFQKQSEICAEVLVPNCVSREFIKGVYVSCNESLEKVKSLLIDSLFLDKVSINSNLFFQ